MRPFFLPLTVLLLLTLRPVQAADPNPAEAKLRESLRNTMLQLRTAQGERDALQARQAQLEQEQQALNAKLEAATKQAAEEAEAARKTVAALEAQNTQQAENLKAVQTSLDKWKAAHQQVTTVAQAKEAARAKSAQQAIELQRRVMDQQAKNRAMYQLGLELLDRYQNFGLGTAITLREPFIGSTRVRLENLVQEYGDKLQEQRLAPEAAPPEPPANKPRARTSAPSPASRTKTGPRQPAAEPSPTNATGQPARKTG